MRIHVHLSSLIAFIFVGIASSAQSAVVLNAVELDGGVVIAGGGTLNLDAWSNLEEPTSDFGRVDPSSNDIIAGPTNTINRYQDVENWSTSSASFGSGSVAFSSFSLGDTFGVIYQGGEPGDLVVPLDYVSGGDLSALSIYSGETFASLGMDIGTYIWSWGSGETADSLTLNVSAIPVPAAVWLFGSGLLGLIGIARRKQANHV